MLNNFEKIRQAYREGRLQVQAVDPDTGDVALHTVTKVMRHEVSHKRAFKVSCGTHEVVATEDHSLFVFEKEGLREILTGDLKVGTLLGAVTGDEVVGLEITSVEEIDPHEHMYDLSVPGPENFVLANSLVAHNSYSIGGISLDIDKSSKYQSMKDNAEQQFEKAYLEGKRNTVKFIRGLKQPKFGFGVRSSFGPNVGRGVLSPRSFV